MFHLGMALLFFLFVFASAFFSLVFIALLSLPPAEVKVYAEEGDARKRRIAALLRSPRELLVTLLMCDITVNILAQNSAASFFGEQADWLLKVGVPLGFTLVIGEILPKTVALPNKERISYHVVPIVEWLQRVLGPVRRAVTFLTTQVSRLLFFFLKKEEEISSQELEHVLETSRKEEILSLEEAELLKGYLSFQDTTVKELMRPRGEILYYDIDEPLSKLQMLFVDQECSQIPFARGEIQNLLGILSFSTFFYHRQNVSRGEDLLPYLRKALYVPESSSAGILLRRFSQKEESLAMVVDEYGAISGLITEEDLFEVVIGEIRDLRDTRVRYTRAGEGILIASGKLELTTFEELFGVTLPSENNMVTLGGWLTEALGDLPKSGAQYTWGPFFFQVLAADPHRVRRIYVRHLPHKEQSP